MPKVYQINKWLLPLALILTIVAGGIAYDLIRLTAEEKLWGYRPFFLYTFVWSALLIFMAWNKERRGKVIPWRRWGLATLSGLMLAFAFPGFLPFPWLLFVSFIPLLILHKDLEAGREKGEKVSLFPYAYHVFFIWNALATFWVTNTALAAGLFAVIVNALLMCIPILLFQRTCRIMPRFSYLSLIAYWITFEYLHMQWDLSWPWLTLGNAFAQMYPTVQWYEFTGVFGGSIWILLMNVLLFQAWERKKAGQASGITPYLSLAALALLPIGISLIMYYSYPSTENVQDVVVVQTNYEPHYQKSKTSESDKISEILALVQGKIDTETDYVLLPETVFGYARRNRLNDYPAVKQLRGGLAPFPGLELVSGLDAVYQLGPDDPHSRATRKGINDDGQTFYWEVYNAAGQFTIGSEEAQFYKKSKLVPGAEIFPFPWLFFFMQPVVDQLGGTTAGFGSQAERTPFSGPKGKVAPVICYESIYGEYFAGYVRQGAQAAFIMTNDGWWDNTPGHLQHLYFASLRAIETRRSIARAANVGISAVINERGDRVQAAKYDEAVALKGTISLNEEITFYVKWGDMIARIALYMSLLLIIGSVAEVLKSRVKGEE